jgi:hypothetical protein
MEDAREAIRAFQVADETCKWVLERENLWDKEYARPVANLKALKEAEWPELSRLLDEFKLIKRECIVRLAPKELAHTYSSVFYASATLPDDGVEIDVIGEMRVRSRAAKALLERIQAPDKFESFHDDSIMSAAQSKMNSQAYWGVGYEVVLAEAEWLLSLAPEGDKAECARIVDEIKAGLKDVHVVFEQIGTFKSSKSEAARTLNKKIQDTRKEAQYRLEFPKNVKVRGAPDPAPAKKE